MRIIAGNWKGRSLKSVKGMQTRPTSDKVKGAIFNIIGDKVKGAQVLDLFAGTGSLSWEALSRGAATAVLVEKNRRAGEIIDQNIEMLGAQLCAKVYKMDALTYLKQQHEQKFDLIFLDPPYQQGLVPKVMPYLHVGSRLQENGVIIIETASDEDIGEAVHPFEIRITKEYGDTKIWFLQIPEV